MVETIVGIAVPGIGFACIKGALTRMNGFAATGRNMTGAYAALMSQIDLFQSIGPFKPPW